MKAQKHTELVNYPVIYRSKKLTEYPDIPHHALLYESAVIDSYSVRNRSLSSSWTQYTRDYSISSTSSSAVPSSYFPEVGVDSHGATVEDEEHLEFQDMKRTNTENESKFLDFSENGLHFPRILIDLNDKSLDLKQFEQNFSYFGNRNPTEKFDHESSSISGSLSEYQEDTSITPFNISKNEGSEPKYRELIYKRSGSLKSKSYCKRFQETKVGLESFSNVKLLGHGDIGKVFLVKENATNHLYALNV